MKNSYSIFGRCYIGSLQCKEAMFKTHKKKINQTAFTIKSMLYLMILASKIVMSRFLPKIEVSSVFGLSWELYPKRFKDYDDKIQVVEYYYDRFSIDEISIFGHLKLMDLFYLIVDNTNYSRKITIFEKENDNIFFRLVNKIEFCLTLGLLRDNSIEHIVIAGINDRMTIYVCELARHLKVKTTVLQHGAFTRFDNNYLTVADEFCYLYDFSISYLHLFFRDVKDIKLKHLPYSSSKKVFSNRTDSRYFISFATTPSNIHINMKIIDILSSVLPSNVALIVNPHPRESLSDYSSGVKNVIVTRDKYLGALSFFTRISSLGVEMDEEGENVCFVNVENHHTDFIDSGNYRVVKSFDELEGYVKSLVMTLE